MAQLPGLATPSGGFAVAEPNIEYVKPYVGAVSQVYSSDDVGHDEMWSDTPQQAWAPRLETSEEGFPDALRVRARPSTDYRPAASQPGSEWSIGPGAIGKEGLYRHQAVESPDTLPNTVAGLTESKFKAANPYWTPGPEPRSTTRSMPAVRTYMRPWDAETYKGAQGRGLTGQHFSLADHRRTYDVYGMEPMRDWRNTDYQAPGPWDVNIVDAAPAFDAANARLTPTDIPGRSLYKPLGT